MATQELSETAIRILRLFGELQSETLDLHTLLELVGSNDPQERERVFDTVENLVSRQILEERGNDYYAPTELGSRITTLKDEWKVNEEDPATPPTRESSLTRLAIYAALAALIIFLFIAWRYS
jgi:hypothetical protein